MPKTFSELGIHQSILQSLTDQYIFVHSPATLQSTTDNITIANNITVYRPNDLGKIISNFWYFGFFGDGIFEFFLSFNKMICIAL